MIVAATIAVSGLAGLLHRALARLARRQPVSMVTAGSGAARGRARTIQFTPRGSSNLLLKAR